MNESIKVPETWKKLDLEGMRNAAELFYIQNIQGSDVLNLDTGATIHFSRVGRKKSIHGSNAGPTKLQAVQVLPEMVRKGKLMRKEPAKKGTKGVEFWILTATVSVDGESHEFWLYIRATKNHQLFYEHTVKVINKNGLGVNGATLAARRWRPRKPDQQIYNNHAMNELHPNRYINENNNRILQIQQDINQVTRTQSSLFGVRCVLGDPTGQGGIDPETKRMLTEAALALGKEKLQGWAADQQRQIDSQRDNPDTISDLGLSADDEKAATAIVGTLAGAAFTGACIAGTWGIGTPACLALGGVVSGVASALMGKLFGAFRRGAPTQAMTWAGWITSGRWNAPGNNAKFRVDYIAQQIGLVTLQEVFEIVLWQPMFYRPSGTVFPWIAERHTAFRWTSTPLDEALPSGAPKPYAFEHIDQDNRIKEDYAYALMNWKADQADEWQNFVAQCRRLAGQLFAPDPDPVDARQCLFQARPVVYDRSLRKAGFGTPFAPGPAKRFTDSSAWNGYTNILRRNRMGFTWLAMLWMEQCMGSDRVPTRADLENFSTRFNEAQSWALRQLADPNSDFWNTGDGDPKMLRGSNFLELTNYAASAWGLRSEQTKP